MRLSASFFFSALLLAAPGPLAYAQGEFDDEFEDELERPATPQPPARQQRQRPAADEFDLEDEAEARPPSGALEEGDLEAGDFDDEERPPRTTPAEPADAAAAAQARRERRHVLHNTWNGSIGGIRVVDAGSGAPAAFRAQLGLDFFFVDGWLTLPESMDMGLPSDHSHIGGSLSLSWNPWEFLELYASLASWANSNPQENPALFQVLGDTLFGVKANYAVMPWLFLGGDLSIGFLNTVGDIGLVGDSTSFGIRLNASVDLRELESAVPFIARLNLQYWFDNSAALIASAEQQRYEALLDPRPCPSMMGGTGNCQEDRHLVTRVERYALQIDRVDRFTIGIGLEAPLTVMQDFHISPIAEWLLHVPVNRNGYSCLFIPGAGTGGTTPEPGEDGCLDKQGFEAFEQTLTLGVRVTPPLRGLNVFIAVDIGLTGVNTFVRELSGQAPYDVLLGFGYAFDTVPRVQEVEREVVREVVRAPEAPPRGRIAGTAVEQGAGTPIEGALVSFPGRELTALSTGTGGAFRTYELDAGTVEMRIAHPEYHEGTCSAELPAGGGDVEVRCELEALPRMGTLRGRVASESGAGVGGASIRLTGPASRTLTSAPDGLFTANDLPPGTYLALVEAENYLIKQESFEVRAREEARPEIVLIARPRQSLVRVAARAITIRRQVNFATDSAEILPDSTQLMSEIADVILRHPEIRRIEIQGHTDNRGTREHNVDLSQRRAESVRDWLVRAGVDASRLEARGYGPDQPLVPNITAANRARNRRVQFVILERSESQ